jgi:hypothetical protein
MIVEDLDGICGNVMPDVARASGLSNDDLYRTARENLRTLIQTRVIPFGVHAGPRELPFVVCGGHWLSASCVLLDDLFAKMSGALQSESLLASVPVRESLLVFRDVDAGYRQQMHELIDGAEAGQRKQITRRFFRLGPDGLSAAEDAAAEWPA